MTYENTYNASDMSGIVIDILATVAVAAVGFATLIGLVLLYGWFKKRAK